MSSEACCDGLRVDIDGQRVLSVNLNSGVVFLPAELPLDAGEHVIDWIYAKNGNISRGEDRAQIDDIVITGTVGTCEGQQP